MATVLHTDLIDDGLNGVIGVGLSLAICQTEPLTLADCSSLSGSGGKRVSNQEVLSSGELTLGDGANAQSREVTVPEKTWASTVQIAVSSGAADLWIAIYDGTRLLVRTDQLQNQQLDLGGSIKTPVLKFGVAQ